MELKTPFTCGEGSDREWYIHDADGNWIAEAVPADHGEAEEVARRIVACVNACAGISTEDLERHYNAGGGLDEAMDEASLSDHVKAVQQRDQLLAALKRIESASNDMCGARTESLYLYMLDQGQQPLLEAMDEARRKARAAIAAVEQPKACSHSKPILQHTGDGTPVEFCPDCGRNQVAGRAPEGGEAPAADAAGWIEWKGGECPVDGAARVEVKYADGMPGHEIAGSLRWSWIFDGANGGDIIAYRVVQEGAA